MEFPTPPSESTSNHPAGALPACRCATPSIPSASPTLHRTHALGNALRHVRSSTPSSLRPVRRHHRRVERRHPALNFRKTRHAATNCGRSNPRTPPGIRLSPARDPAAAATPPDPIHTARTNHAIDRRVREHRSTKVRDALLRRASVIHRVPRASAWQHY